MADGLRLVIACRVVVFLLLGFSCLPLSPLLFLFFWEEFPFGIGVIDLIFVIFSPL